MIPIAMNIASHSRAATYPIAPSSLSSFRTGYATTAVPTLKTMSRTSDAAPNEMPVEGSPPDPVIEVGLLSMLW